VPLGAEDLPLFFKLPRPVGHFHGDRVLGDFRGLRQIIIAQIKLAGLEGGEGFGLELISFGSLSGSG